MHRVLIGGASEFAKNRTVRNIDPYKNLYIQYIEITVRFSFCAGLLAANGHLYKLAQSEEGTLLQHLSPLGWEPSI
jgi:hypothetical protein